MRSGTRKRKNIVADHFGKTYHKECRQAVLLATKEVSALKNDRTLIDMHISESNKSYANHIGKLMMQVYTDAKRLTLSAYSWPARYVATESGTVFDFNSSNTSIIPENINIQYVNPPGHLDLLTAIVKSWDELQDRIKTSLSSHRRIGG